MKDKTTESVHFALYIARCSGSAMLSYMLAKAIGLPFPVWAAISAVIVSQEKLYDTRTSVSGRIVGTIIGVTVALAVDAATSPFAVGMAVQIALAVAACAIVARIRPVMRVGMWTSPIVLLTASASVPVAAAGVYRGSEVILGCLVGGALHFAAEKLVAAIPWLRDSAKDSGRPASLSDE